jgi:hypothetical protein
MNNKGGRPLTVEDIKRIVSNPYYCIEIHESMIGPHEPIVSEELWIKACTESIKQNGAENFLRNILENLKGNYV